MKIYLSILFLFGLEGFLLAQTVDTAHMQLHQPERWEAYEAIHDLKENGILVVRLDTRTRKLEAIDAILANAALKPNQRKRLEKQKQNTIEDTEKMNATMGAVFKDSFKFAPIYFMYDTNSHHLGTATMMDVFVDWNGQAFEPLEVETIAQEHVFIVDYRVGGGTYPYDVLLMRRLEHKLDDPFPKNIPVRSSFMNDKYSVLKKSIENLDVRLQRYYERF